MDRCRLCLNPFLGRVESNIRLMRPLLNSLFLYEVRSHPGLPEGVCSACTSTVTACYQFIIRVKENQNKLFDVLDGNLPPPSMTEEVPDPALYEPEADVAFSPDLVSKHLDMRCRFCQMKLGGYDQLMHHYQVMHGREGFVFCCKARLNNKAAIMRHLQKHLTKRDLWVEVYGGLLTDFEKVLGEYTGSLPDVGAALRGNQMERKKFNVVHDFLIDKLFVLDCELCRTHLTNQADRRKHFEEAHPMVKYYVSCCGANFTFRIAIMRHMNVHWVPLLNGGVPKPEYMTPNNSVPDEAFGNMEEMPSVNFCQSNTMDDEAGEGTSKTNSSQEMDIKPVLVNMPIKAEPDDSAMESETEHIQESNKRLIERYLKMTCNVCQEEQTSFDLLKYHYVMIHSIPYYILCCGQNLTTDKEIYNHAVHHSSKIISGSSVNCNNILADFKSMLTNYEPNALPNMHLALSGDTSEKNKLNNLQDFLVQRLFQMDCQLCGQKTETIAYRKMHFSRIHPVEKYFTSCCSKRFHTSASEVEHLYQHWKPLMANIPESSQEMLLSRRKRKTPMQLVYQPLMEDFRSDLEEAGFVLPTVIPNSQTLQQIEDVRKMQAFIINKHCSSFDCEVCRTPLSNWAERYTHLSENHTDLEPFIKCCGKMHLQPFRIVNHLLKHKLSLKSFANDVKNIEIDLKCVLCNHPEKTYAGLRKHFKLKHPKDPFRFECCGRSFNEKNTIIYHLNSKHSSVPQHVCPVCHTPFASAQILELHVNRKHASEDQKRFGCVICGKKFATELLLRHHSYWHQTTHCDLCGISVHRFKLRAHMLSVHQNEPTNQEPEPQIQQQNSVTCEPVTEPEPAIPLVTVPKIKLEPYDNYSNYQHPEPCDNYATTSQMPQPEATSNHSAIHPIKQEPYDSYASLYPLPNNNYPTSQESPYSSTTATAFPQSQFQSSHFGSDVASYQQAPPQPHPHAFQNYTMSTWSSNCAIRQEVKSEPSQ
ncbi:zinc finger protein 99-like [Uranotaenia lowii]|uniref:zinc finger protein 99-like n=1 Tax=Uranotaenia lowii TaxID=190385 RepID=UPI0024792B77|nr:zinc finger protein 99-like [Uranotaenia lowii]